MKSTRDRILSVYEEMAISGGRGLYNISLEEVAQEAGVNKRTIYRYFSGREEIVAAMLEIIMEKTASRITEILAGEKEIKDMLIEVIKTISYLANGRVLADLRQYYPLLWKKIDLFRRQNVQQFFDSLMKNKNMEMRWRVNPLIAREVFNAALSAVVNPQYILENSLTFEEVGTTVFELFVFGAVEKVDQNRISSNINKSN